MHRNRILIVDDDPINCLLIGKILDKENYGYQLVNSAMEAFGMLSDKSYSLIIMDIEMPIVNGLEASNFIRGLNADYFKDIPIIALTSHREKDILKNALSAGINDVLSKPIDAIRLLATIESYISSN